MNIDRIAGAMTGGRPRADFAARVMAPIYGRPQPGFTVRVMDGLDAPKAGRGYRARRAAFLLVPAAIALIAGVMTVGPSRVDVPPAPAAPKLATSSREGRLPVPLQAPVATTPPRIARRATASAPVEEPAVAQLPPIYMIPALEGPPDITMKSIEPAAVAITPLAAPAPLTVPSLEGSKEKS